MRQDYRHIAPYERPTPSGIARAIVLMLCSLGAQHPFGTRGSATVAQVRGLPSTIYVGQSIEVHVVITAGPDEPSITLPTSPDLLLTSIDKATRRSLPDGRVDHDFPVRLVANRAGKLRLPPIRMTDGDRDGATIAREFLAKMPPASGRTSEYLGGVGRVNASSEASPRSIRLGDAFEFRVELTGPGAPGSTKPVVLELAEARIQMLEPIIDLKRRSRIQRFSIRPDRAGSLTVPPIRVAWFDPVSQRYQTSLTSSIRVEVSRPPPVSADAPTTVVSSKEWSTVWLLLGLSLIFAIGLVITGLQIRGRGHWSARRRRRRLTTRLVSHLSSIKDERLFARTFMIAVSAIMETIDGDAPRAVTPLEFQTWLIGRTTPTHVAEEGYLLVERCDQILYSTLTRSPSMEPSRERFLEFLTLLSTVAANRPGSPRQAGSDGSSG